MLFMESKRFSGTLYDFYRILLIFIEWVRSSVIRLDFFEVKRIIIINLISDIKGRRPSMIVALAFANIGGVCNYLSIKGAFFGATYESIPLLFLSQLLGGFGAYALIPLTYTILSDLCSDKYRQKGIVFVNSAW